MNLIELELQNLERQINKKREELIELNRDKSRVKNERVLEFIMERINFLEKSIENTEFKIWKLSK